MQVDDTPPLVSRSGKLIELLPSGPISLIGNNSPSLAAIMHRGVRLKKVSTKRTKASPSVAASTVAQAFKVNFQILLPIPIPSLHLLHLYSQIFIVVSAHRYIGKGQKYNCRCPQSSQPKRKGAKSTRSQAKRQRIATHSPPPVSPILVESSPSSPETQTQQIPSPPQLPEEPQVEELQPEVPQPEEISTDVHEQTTDPSSLIIASVVSSIQTSTAPPQGNMLSIYCR